MITHFLNLDVCTNGIHKEMRFLVTDIGHEEILLGYPWLGNPRVAKVNPDPYPLKTRTLVEGTGF
jgi:hypothetical protein